jgi:Tfp pilus assembly protein PilN
MTQQAEQYERATERVQQINRQFAVDAQRIGVVLSQGRAQAMAREVAFANRLLETRAFSWTRFLNDLEQAVPEHISIKSVQVNFKDSSITLNGNALTLKDVTILVDELENHPAFFNVTLTQHKVQDKSHDHSSTGIQPIDFSLTVGYRPNQ